MPPDTTSTLATGVAIVIRRATPADLDVLTALRAALREEERISPATSPERLRELTWRQLNGIAQAFHVAEADGEVVGMLRCVLQAAPAEAPRSALLTTAYVAPTHRRRGIMRELVRAADAWGRGHGVRELRLRNAYDNPGANAAWEALGFSVVQVVRRRTDAG